MINIEKLKIVLDLYKDGAITHEKAHILLSEPIELKVGEPIAPILPHPFTSLGYPWGFPPIITYTH